MKSILLLSLLLVGCTTEKHRVLVATTTIIGLDISQNPQTQMYTAKLGYNRGEIALLPTNRGTKDDPGTGSGAKDVPDVLMELRYANMFSLTEAGLYQRLAVGSVAVGQPGAAFMFAKGKSGDLDAATASAVASSIKTIPAPNPKVTANVLPLAQAYDKSDNKAAFDGIAQIQGYRNFSEFLINPNLTQDKVQTMTDSLKHVSLVK